MSTQGGIERRRWLTLYALCIGQLMIILDGTIVNVALPAIRDDLGFSDTALAWVVNSYLISFGSLLMLFGRLGDIRGRKSVTLSGLALFTVASALCGLSTSPWMLITGRFTQGVGGAAATAGVLALVVELFPRRDERARALGIYSFIGIAGGSIGLVLGGILTESLSWHWIFFVNLPLGAAALALGVVTIPSNAPRSETPRSIDVAGAALLTILLMLSVTALIKINDVGVFSPFTATLTIAAVAVACAFVAVERRTADPLVPLHALRSRTLTGTCVIISLLLVAMVGWFFFISLYLGTVLHFSARTIGFAFMPATTLIAVMSLGLTARLIHLVGPRRVAIAGLVSCSLGLIWLARIPVDGHYAADVLPAMLLMGAGAGLTFTPLINVAMNDDAVSSGLSSGLVNTAQQIGAAIGLALLASIAAAATASPAGKGEASAGALVHGYHIAYLAALGAAVLAAVAVVIVVPAGRALGAHVAHEETPQGSWL